MSSYHKNFLENLDIGVFLTGLPDWAQDSFGWYSLNYQRTTSSLELAMMSLRQVESLTTDPRSEEHTNLSMRVTGRIEQALLCQATVMIWGHLEAVIEDFLIALYQHGPSKLQTESARRIQVSLMEFETKTPEERGRYILRQLKQKISDKDGSNINRFEDLLDAFGLGGEVTDEMRRVIREMGNIRNVLVHRAGLADQRLIDACPWLNLTKNHQIILHRQQYETYIRVVHEYVTAVSHRIYRHFGWLVEKKSDGNWNVLPPQ